MAASLRRAAAALLLLALAGGAQEEACGPAGPGCEGLADDGEAPALELLQRRATKESMPEAVEVQTISLADVLELSRHAEGGPRLMKMDIEGSEFGVLRDSLRKQLLCKGTVDLLTIEWHLRLFEKLPKEYNDANDAMQQVLHRKRTPACTPTVFETIDDESYLHDRQPMPEVSEQAKEMFRPRSGNLTISADMFKGCRAIFYDVGSNLGTHIRKLFEPTKYPESYMLKVFDSIFGAGVDRSKPSKQTGLCAFGFEANPYHAPVLANLEATYNAAGWRVKFFAPAVVSQKAGQTVQFYLNGHKEQEYWGAGIFNVH